MFASRYLVACGLLSGLLPALASSPGWSQIISADEGGGANRYGEPQVRGFRVGVEVSANRGACRDVLAMVAVPLSCPEQQVKQTGQEISPQVKVEYRDLSDGVRQLLVRIPYLAAGEQVRALISYEVTTRPLLPLPAAHEWSIPRRPAAPLKPFLGTSPYIESRHRKIRSAAREALGELADDASDWQKVESLYDYVRSAVAYEEGPDKSAAATLQEGKGDCYAISAVFVALCRASGVPARMVWVENHCYPEFYLENGAGEGAWFPCESAGERAFGAMPRARIVFQKGDNFRIPERPKDRLRYASDWAHGKPVRGGGKPRVVFVREPL